MNTLLAVGLGYSARVLAARLAARGWQIIGTGRSADSLAEIRARDARPVRFTGEYPTAEMFAAINFATHLLVSAPPDEGGDPLLRNHGHDLERARSLRWVGYLSTIGVYGDHGGRWVDESTPPRPISLHSRKRLQAEQAWQAFAERADIAVQIFRLSGIYGPGRNAVERLRAGTERVVFKPGQVFNRIHVADIATTLERAMRLSDEGRLTGQRGTVFNVTDDEPAPPQDVSAFAAGLLGVTPPPPIPLEHAELSPMARSFYEESKRARNDRIKHELGVALAFPSYREGLRALAGEGD